MISATVAEAIKAHAVRIYPQESCGLIVDGVYRRCRNVSDEPENSFKISPGEWVAASKEGVIQGVVHSHPGGPDCPSEDDMARQMDAGVPWWIVSTNGEGCLAPFAFGDGLPTPPLIGRGFRHGVTDCYALIRDWYRQERGVSLRDYPRDWEWWNNGGDFYQEKFSELGFSEIEVEDAEPGDVFMASIRSDVPNHGGIYIGRGVGLHHRASLKAADASRLSKRAPLALFRDYNLRFLHYDS